MNDRNRLPRHPAHELSVLQASAMLVGVVVGIGVFKTPQIVAANSSTELMFLGLWLAGGVLTLIGAMCYAELSSSYPNAGGEYHYLTKAYGEGVGFLFAWGRMTVMQTGAIAAVGFVYGDYANVIFPLEPYGPAIHAAIALVALTSVQLIGTELSGRTQLLLTVLTIAAVATVSIVGLVAEPRPAAAASPSGGGAAGLALVFVLLTYGGWNEVAYVSGEVKEPRRNMARVLLAGIAMVIGLYMLASYSFVRVFGLSGLRDADTVAADLLRQVFGDSGAAIVSAFVMCTALSTLNATIFTGARTNLALGQSFPLFSGLGARNQRGTPANAILLQTAIAIGLIGFGSMARDGFTHMVEYTAPVFWGFMLLIGLSLFLFRNADRDRPAAFRVPLYPVTPAIFCATSAYLLYSSVVYTGLGALVGMAIFAAGLPVYLLGRRTGKMLSEQSRSL